MARKKGYRGIPDPDAPGGYRYVKVAMQDRKVQDCYQHGRSVSRMTHELMCAQASLWGDNFNEAKMSTFGVGSEAAAVLRNYPKGPATLELRRLRNAAKRAHTKVEHLEKLGQDKRKRRSLRYRDQRDATMEAISRLHADVKQVEEKIEDTCIWVGPIPKARKRKKKGKRRGKKKS